MNANSLIIAGGRFSSALISIVLIVSWLWIPCSPLGGSERPNIVLVFIDDMGWGDLSCFGNQIVKTKNIDRLAHEGLRFEQFYVNSPICSPSRAAISTGQYPQRWKITSYLNNRKNNIERGMAQWLDPRAPSLARILQQAGYATGHFGKWHLGGQRDVGEAPLITEYGFDASLTNFEGLGPRVLPLCNAFNDKPPRRHALGSDKLGRGPIRWEDRSQVTAAFTSEALAFIKQAQAKGKPFYINLWPDDVHSPFFPPKGRRGDAAKRTLYHAVLETMDEQLGELLDYIRTSETLRQNTLILVCSDNGPERGAGSAGPFRGFKTMLYEGGIRSPLVIWGPGLIDKSNAGSVNTISVLAAIDLAPSMLALAGVDPPPDIKFDGENLKDVLIGKSKNPRQAPIFFRRPPDRNTFYGIRNLPDLAVRQGNWKLLCEYDGSRAELYNLASDSGETTDLADKRPNIVKRLKPSLLAWHKSLPEDNGATYRNQPRRRNRQQAGTDQPGQDGDGSIVISGKLKQWHKLTFTLDGPFARETDNQPNPFTDYRMTVRFTHQSGQPDYSVPGYFAADGDAANSSASSGVKWRAHLSPDKLEKWSYKVSFLQGRGAAIGAGDRPVPRKPYHDKTGKFTIAATDTTSRDLRGKGRLQYVGKRYLQFAGSGEYFLKAGADAPETLLAYADFDGTIARKKTAPLKTWNPHVQDWRPGDPSWKSGKGKGLIGAVNYLSSKGCNAFSFLTYNAGGDGDNVWPFVSRNDKRHYDCSKLDQWGIVFDHATRRGMYLHFKMQETEMDDDGRRQGSGKSRENAVPESLDGGELGIERKLYCRELVARFAHNLALNWNLGEENTQSTKQQRAMAAYLRKLDPYDHLIVVHTFPNQQDKVYRPLLGDGSVLSGASLQNSHIKDTHVQTVKWVRESARAGKPWVIAFDESGSAAHGQPPDLGYRGFDGKDRSGKYIYTEHQVRKQTLWGVLMAGGAGVEYYFGYQFAENDLVCQDWRSRDNSWDYCRIAIEFFADHKIPFWEMTNADELVGNPQHDNTVYCFAKPGEIYLVYLPSGGAAKLDLSKQSGDFSVKWFDPRRGGELLPDKTSVLQGGSAVRLGPPPSDVKEDWLVVVRRVGAK